MYFLIGMGIFVSIVLLIEGSYFAIQSFRNPEKKLIQRRLHSLTSLEYGNVDIVRKRVFSEIPWLNRKLNQLKRMENFGLLLEQAGVRMPLGFYLLISALLIISGFTLGTLLKWNFFISLMVGLCLGCLPFVHILVKKQKRMNKFQRQLPEALDLVARALRAGHAFSGTLKMVADEMGDPIGEEFDKTLNEINFGIGVAEALKNLTRRVDCLDLKFFVIAVVVQRETGGNLAEILENIARIIRERFKLYGRIRILAAEGKLSAIILTALPFVTAFILFLANPEYVQILLKDPIGKGLSGFGLILMVVGIFSMKRMIAIKV